MYARLYNVTKTYDCPRSLLNRLNYTKQDQRQTKGESHACVYTQVVVTLQTVRKRKKTHLLEEVLERLFIFLHQTVDERGPRHVALARYRKLLIAQVVKDLRAVLQDLQNDDTEHMHGESRLAPMLLRCLSHMATDTDIYS